MKLVRTIFCTVLLLTAIVTSSEVNQVAAQDEFKPITVFLVRHAEKADEPRQDPPLLEKGVARSQELARILTNGGVKAIYASQFKRTQLTGEPIAKQLGLTVTPITLKSNPKDRMKIAEESTAEIVNKILAHPGENALVIGHSNSVPDVIKMLGGDVVPTIDEKTFNDIFIVTVFAKNKARVVHLKYGSAE